VSVYVHKSRDLVEMIEDKEVLVLEFVTFMSTGRDERGVMRRNGVHGY